MEVDYGGWLGRATMEGWLWRGNYGGWLWRATMEGRLWRGDYEGWLWRAYGGGDYGGVTMEGNYGGETMEVLDYGGWLWRGDYGGGNYGGAWLWKDNYRGAWLWRATMEGHLWRKEIICFSWVIFQRLSAILEKHSDEHFRWKFETAINWIWNLEILSFPMMYDSHSPSQWYHLVNFWSLYHGYSRVGWKGDVGSARYEPNHNGFKLQ